MNSYLLGGSNGERRLVSLRVFAECRSEQEWTAGQSKGDSAKAISYYLVCRGSAPLIREWFCTRRTWSSPDLLYQGPAV